MTDRERLDKWLADSAWAEIGGDGGDAMRCRPHSDDSRAVPAPWISGLSRTRVLEADAATAVHGPSTMGLAGRLPSADDQPSRGHEPRCPVHGPNLGGICWRCTEHLGSRFTGVATVDPDTGLLAFRRAGPPTGPDE